VLIGASAIPVWHENRKLLLAHFLTSGSAVRQQFWNCPGSWCPRCRSCDSQRRAIETLIGVMLESRRGRVDAPLHHGRSGWTMRICRDARRAARSVYSDSLARYGERALRRSGVLPHRSAVQPLRMDLGRPSIRSRSSGSVSTSTQSLKPTLIHGSRLEQVVNQAAAIATSHSRTAARQSKNDNGSDSRD
jgi:hypothetical protein